MSTISVGEKDDVLNGTISFERRKGELEAIDASEKAAIKRKRSSPFNKFVQFNSEVSEAEDALLAESATAYRVFKFLTTNMDNYNAVACSYEVIKERLNLSTATVTRALRLLKDRKFLDVYKSGTSNVYLLNKVIVWNSWGSNYKYAKFAANVMLSSSEQKKCKGM